MKRPTLPLIVNNPVYYDDTMVRFVVQSIAYLTGGYDFVILEFDNSDDENESPES